MQTAKYSFQLGQKSYSMPRRKQVLSRCFLHVGLGYQLHKHSCSIIPLKSGIYFPTSTSTTPTSSADRTSCTSISVGACCWRSNQTKTKQRRVKNENAAHCSFEEMPMNGHIKMSVENSNGWLMWAFRKTQQHTVWRVCCYFLCGISLKTYVHVLLWYPCHMQTSLSWCILVASRVFLLCHVEIKTDLGGVHTPCVHIQTDGSSWWFIDEGPVCTIKRLPYLPRRRPCHLPGISGETGPLV